MDNKKNYKKLMTQKNIEIPLSFKNNFFNYDENHSFNYGNHNKLLPTNLSPPKDTKNLSYYGYGNSNNSNIINKGNYSYDDEIIYPASEVEYNTFPDTKNINSNKNNNYYKIDNKQEHQINYQTLKNYTIINKPPIDQHLFKQFMLIRQYEKNERIKALENEKEILRKENRKLSQNLPSLNEAKQMLNKEKELFQKEKNKIIDTLRQNEEHLLKLENNIQNNFLPKKQELKDLMLQVKEEEQIFYNEKVRMNDDYNNKFNELENNYKNKERMIEENNNINIDKLRKENELIRQKENEINNLKNQYLYMKNNLDMKENELNNKEIELKNKENNLNNKYGQLIEKEKYLSNEKNNILGNIQNDENDLNQLSLELKDKQRKLKDKEYQLIYVEKSLKEKENEIKNREDNIINRQNMLNNKLYEQVSEINSKENELNDKLSELNDKEMELKKLKNEIETKRNQIDELNNQYNNILENINLEKTKNDNSNYNNDINNNNFNILNEPQNETRPSISVKKIQKKPKESKFYQSQNNNLMNNNNNIELLDSKIRHNNPMGSQNNNFMGNNNLELLDNKIRNNPMNNQNADIQDNDSYPENFGEDFMNNNTEPQNQFFDNGNQNFNNNNINNKNNNEDEYYDFDNYVDNQSNSQQIKDENNNDIYNSNPNNNDNFNNDNFNNDNNQLNYFPNDENTPGNGDNFDNMPNDNNISQKPLQNSKNTNLSKMGNKNVLKSIYTSVDTMKYNNVEDTSKNDLYNLNGEDFDIKESQNSNKKESNSKGFNLDDIKEELFIEQYNPSLGLTKIENPKYMNAILQCIAHIPEVTDTIINLHINPNYKNVYHNLVLSNAYREFLINVFLPEKALNLIKMPYKPKNFLNTFSNLNKNFQNDNNYKEFIKYLLTKLHEELNINLNDKKSDLYKSTFSNKNIDIKNENDTLIDFLQNFTDKNNSVIVKNIYGIIKDTLYCHKCQNSFYNYHCYSYFYFNLAKIVENKQAKYNNANITLDLYDCLDYYQKAETLLGDKALYCPICNEHNESTSLKCIYSTKNILIFIFDNIKGDNLIQNYFDYNEIINLRDYVQIKKDEKKSKEKFYLSGVVNFVEDNYGNEAFFAFCKMGKNHDWFCYDNENVYPVTFQEIKNNGFPVVLIYHKLIKK